MNIAYLMGTSTSTALEALYGERKKQEENKESGEVASWKPDVISISAEARALAAIRETAMGGNTDQGQNFAADQQQDAQENGAVGGSGAGMGSGTGKSQANIEAKIKELHQKIMEVQSSAIPDETKQGLIAGLEAQINALMQELNDLKTQAAA